MPATHHKPGAPDHSRAVLSLVGIRYVFHLDLTGDQPRLLDSMVIANNLAVHTDPAALIVGPTGLALGPPASCSSPTP
ncbi:MAG: hypothetical protein ACRDRO_28265 [Pseudonocardiaceae bacterium]